MHTREAALRCFLRLRAIPIHLVVTAIIILFGASIASAETNPENSELVSGGGVTAKSSIPAYATIPDAQAGQHPALLLAAGGHYCVFFTGHGALLVSDPSFHGKRLYILDKAGLFTPYDNNPGCRAAMFRPADMAYAPTPEFFNHYAAVPSVPSAPTKLAAPAAPGSNFSAPTSLTNETPTSLPESDSSESSSWVSLLEKAGGIAAFLCFGGFFLRKAIADVNATVAAEKAWAPINSRFPPNTLFRVPDWFAKYAQNRYPDVFKKGELGQLVTENRLGEWTAMLKLFPLPPKTDSERIEREEIYWKVICHTHIVPNSEPKELRPKQMVMDSFKSEEKWRFRWYYAATGINHNTIMMKMTSIFEEIRKWQNHTAVSEKERDFRDRKLETAVDLEKRFFSEEFPAHLDKWAEWYYFKVEEAFRKLYRNNEAPFGRNSTNSTHGAGQAETRHKPVV